jgi:hypothetical protein
MRKKEYNVKIPVISITTSNEVIKQETIVIQEHDALVKYKMLSINNFGEGTVHCPGYFNNKTNFIIGEQNSLLSVNRKVEVLVKNTSELIDSDMYMLYPIPCFSMEQSLILDYTTKEGTTYEIPLTFELGKLFGRFLVNDNIQFDGIPDGFINLFVNRKNGTSLNKNLLINSNADFVLGILQGYYKEVGERGFYILPNVNIYTISTILNYLGSSYSIRNSKNNSKKVYMQLPTIFKDRCGPLFYKKDQFVVTSAGLVKVSHFGDHESYMLESKNDLEEKINLGTILAIPYNSISFVESLDNRVYDLTAERGDATNYAMNFTPFLKNSDGDILAASGIFTKEGLADAQVFSPDSKEYYKDLNEGKINQWIADDAILGLYNSTK